MARLRLILGIATWGCLITACTHSVPSSSTVEDKLVVFAAASLRDAFTAMRQEFERQHPSARVRFHFAGSQQLRTQLEHGASADVFASADSRQLSELRRTSRVSPPVVFARNEPVLVVASESAHAVRSLSDLPHAASIVLGSPEVPIGAYAIQILKRAQHAFGYDFRARVEARVVSREFNVRQVLAKISLGEAQAGFVYRSDVPAAQGSVHVVTIPHDLNVLADYPIAIVRDAAHPRLAQAWVDFVMSVRGQQSLRKAGFMTPDGDATTP